MPGVQQLLRRCSGPYAALVTPATEDEVFLALAAPSTWPVALAVDDRYVPLTELDGVAERISARLGGVPRRVGESTYLLGLAARLWGATLGPVVRDGVLPDPRELLMRDEGGAVQLGIRRLAGWRDVTPDDLLAAVVEVLTPVVRASRLSPRLMWGNVASALYAAPRVLQLPGAAPWAAELLTRPPFAGEMRDGRRATCCLFYEVAGGGLCGDCVLRRVPARA